MAELQTPMEDKGYVADDEQENDSPEHCQEPRCPVKRITEDDGYLADNEGGHDDEDDYSDERLQDEPMDTTPPP